MNDEQAGARRAMLADVVRGVLIGGLVLALTLPPIGWALQRAHPPAVARAAVTGAPAVAQPLTGSGAPSLASNFGGVALQPGFGEVFPQPGVRRVAVWVAASRDNRDMPFAILDKADARVYVFSPQAQLIGTSPVLLGGAVGDDSVAGIGERAIADVLPEERTTPAGRFVSQPGRNAIGENVVWVDYGAAVSMHRVRLSNPKEHRLERLATPSPDDNRISYGCINVPVAFFDHVVEPVLAQRRAVVYVLPETRPLEAVFAMNDWKNRMAETPNTAQAVTYLPQ